jgi:drug/metabolite transporter (DMT)-like permease
MSSSETQAAAPARPASVYHGPTPARPGERAHVRPLSPPPTVRKARWLLFVAGVLFGLSALLAKLASVGGMTGGQVTLVRFGFGIAFVFALFRARPGTFRPVRYGLLVSRGLFGGIAALLYFLSIEKIPAGEATLLNNTFPIWAVVISFFLLNERPTLHLGIALGIATAGVFLVLGGGQVSFGLGSGEILGIVSAIFGGAAVTSIRALRATDNAPTIFFAMSVGGFLVSIPYAFHAWPLAAGPWLAAFGVGVAAFLAQLCMTEAYGALGIAEAALWQQLTPIASYIWALTVGERIGVATALGVLLGAVGIVYGSLLGHRPQVPASREARIAEGIPAEEP